MISKKSLAGNERIDKEMVAKNTNSLSEKEFSCGICDKHFDKKVNLNAHVSSVHMQNKNYEFINKNSML